MESQRPQTKVQKIENKKEIKTEEGKPKKE
jgi:hypothetical protein